MPVSLLPEELENPDLVAEDLKKVKDAMRDDMVTEEDLTNKIDELLRKVAQATGRFVEKKMKGMAVAYEQAWQQIVANVAKGQTAEMHAERPGLLNNFETWLGLLKQAYDLLTMLHKRGRTELDPDFLLPEIAGMERLKAHVFDLWQSAEDLEHLAAKEEARNKLARAHYSHEPGITAIFTVCAPAALEILSSEPIKLLEVNKNTIPTGIMPLGFDASPANGIPFPSVIIEVTPAEWDKIQRLDLKLPEGWSLGPLVPRSDTPTGEE